MGRERLARERRDHGPDADPGRHQLDRGWALEPVAPSPSSKRLAGDLSRPIWFQLLASCGVSEGVDRGVATSGQQDLRRRLERAVRIWREVTDVPLPRLRADSPDKQVAALEMELVELLADRADPRCAADLQFQLAELTEGRPSDDPVNCRVSALLPLLHSLDSA